MLFTAPQLASVVIVAKSAGIRDAEARFFAFHVAARLRVGRGHLDSRLRQHRRALLLVVVGDEHAGEPQEGHRGEQRPALPRIPHHLAERVSQARGIRKIRNIWNKLENGVGFSNGCAELALKNPPPLVPSILMASCDATGPCAMVCFAPSSVVATV